MKPAPIALFCYNRPEHLRVTVEGLLKNDLAHKTDLFVFCDAAKDVTAQASVDQVRAYLKKITGFNNITIDEKASNFGLADSIISGVTQVVAQYGRVIVMEDDLLVSPFFLQYMNDALELYQNDENVISIHGYIYPIQKKLPETFFLKGADCWGWATWKRGWDLFNPNGQDLLDQLKEKNLTKEFDFDDAYPYTKMLEDWTQGQNNSWAIRWYASAFLANKLTLYPGRSLVFNTGNDGSGTHCGVTDSFSTEIYMMPIKLQQLPAQEDNKSKKLISSFLKPQKKMMARIRERFRKKSKRKKPQSAYGWFKTNLSWSNAKTRCTGYDEDLILEQCKNSLLKVKNGEAVYERDSVLFDKIEYSWPLLTALMLAAANHEGKLRVLDLGGSLGSTYYQNKKFLQQLKSVNWNIVEQERFVDCGKQYFESSTLKFCKTIDECIKTSLPNVAIVSSVLQYVENPYGMLQSLIDTRIDYLIFDRTAFNTTNQDMLTIQKVPPEIYRASYPAWFLNKERVMQMILVSYDIIESFNSVSNPIIVFDGAQQIYCSDEGFICRRRTKNG